ncbi:MAG: tRNA pseudouridine(55) synthase TruB [Bacteroidetes bacterium]|nr:MAG: tRNA pseudouridine(55) synthase TruB [Bacteroidota bacterium]
MTQNDFYNGQVILVNKPKTWTSFDVVNKMRSDLRHTYQIPFAKIGHAGTLDPLATGLLIVCIGRKTKTIEQFQGMEKEYTGTMMLGCTTPSYDMETPVNERYSIAHITPELIKEAAKKFVGAVWQYPPDFSAKKIQGDRAYNIARSGGHPDIKPNLVNISKFEIVDVLLPMVEFKVVCGKGTYIRSLAHDLGRQLGCGGLLASLCRTRIGKYKLKGAKELKDWMEAAQPTVAKKRIPVRTAMKKAKERAKERKKMVVSSGKPSSKKKTGSKKKPAAKKESKGKKRK